MAILPTSSDQLSPTLSVSGGLSVSESAGLTVNPPCGNGCACAGPSGR